MNHRIAKTLDQLLVPAVLILLAFTFYEMGAGSSAGLMEIILVFTLSLLGLRFFVSPHSFIKQSLHRLRPVWPVAVIAGLYLLWDAVTLLYAPSGEIAWLKYRVVLYNLLWLLCLLSIAEQRDLSKWMALVLGVTAVILCLIAVYDRFWGGFYPAYYETRFTLRQDYNMFAMTILFGLVLGFIYMDGLPLQRTTICLVRLLFLAITIPILYLSGSRRAFLLLLFFLPLMVVQSWKKANWKGLLPILLAVVSSFFLVPFLQRCMADVPPSKTVQDGIPNTTTAAQRYETLFTGGFLGKRVLLWRVAWEDAASFSGKEQIIGRGNGYDIVLYDRATDEELLETYPIIKEERGLLSAHNLLLADYLGGGWVKLSLCLLLLAALGVSGLKLVFAGGSTGLFWCLCLWVALFCDLISNRFGLLYDKFACLFAFLVLIQLSQHRREQQGG